MEPPQPTNRAYAKNIWKNVYHLNPQRNSARRIHVGELRNATLTLENGAVARSPGAEKEKRKKRDRAYCTAYTGRYTECENNIAFFVIHAGDKTKRTGVEKGGMLARRRSSFQYSLTYRYEGLSTSKILHLLPRCIYFLFAFRNEI